MERDTTVVLYKLARKLSLHFSEADIIQELQLHPSYNSLLGMSEVLTSWNVPNLALKIKAEQLKELPSFFITLLVNGEFAFVTRKQDEMFLVETKSKKRLLSFIDLTQHFTGTVLLAEANPEFLNKPTIVQRCLSYLSAHKAVFWVLLILMGLSLNLYDNFRGTEPHLWYYTLLFLKTLGLGISFLLLAQTVNGNNALVKRICTAFDKNGCSTILISDAAKVFDGLSWSEVGAFYFGGTWLVVLLNMSNKDIGIIMLLINLPALPYTFYSIYYQSRIAKSWCILCCAVQLLLWLELFTLLPAMHEISELKAGKHLFLYAIEMFAPVILWLSLRDVFYGHQRSKTLSERLRKFSSNKGLFEMQLAQYPRLQLLSVDDTLNFGNINAKTTLTMVTNPYCEPCMHSHQIIHRWLETRDDLNLQLVFAVDGPEDYRTKVASHLLELKAQTSPEAARHAFSAWSSGRKNFKKWRERHPVSDNTGQEYRLAKHRDWCTMAGIKHTPTFFINGQLLPDIYQIEDVKYLV